MVVDTCIFIDYLRAKDKMNTELFKIPSDKLLFISSVTLYELLMGATSSLKREDIRLLTEDIRILPFDEQVSIKSAEIYHNLKKSNKLIEFRDIFIAATCLVNHLPLKTLNIKHFQRIEELRILITTQSPI